MKQFFLILNHLIIVHNVALQFSVFPVEYKKGKPKLTEEDKLQVVAQALCLEEMFSTRVEQGAIFYGETRRREQIEITKELREKVIHMLAEMHQYYARKYTPKVKPSKAWNKTASVKTYIEQRLEEEE